jgi:hypothetical protein
MAFANFMRSIGKVLTPPKRIRDWRQQKRQYRRYLQDLGQDAAAVRSGVRAWMKNNPKPKRTREERDQSLSEIPQIYEKVREEFGTGNGSNGPQSETIGYPPVRKAGFNPLFLLLLIPVLFPKLLKNF